MVCRFHDLLSLHIPTATVDTRWQMRDMDGSFSVTTFFKLYQEIYRLSILCGIWSLKAPPRVLAFGWLAVLTTILTKVHVWRCKKIIVDACPADA